MSVPDTETEQEFIIHQPEEEVTSEPSNTNAPDAIVDDEFDLSDISAQPREQSREDIIAAAEAAAFEEQE